MKYDQRIRLKRKKIYVIDTSKGIPNDVSYVRLTLYQIFFNKISISVISSISINNLLSCFSLARSKFCRIEAGIDYPHNDIQRDQVKNIEACEQKCREVKKCVGIFVC